MQGALSPLWKGRQPAIVDLAGARAILKAADETPAHPVTKLALRLLALTAVRPGTLTGTPWAELDAIDEADPVWRIPAERMKLRKHFKGDPARDHLVPLSCQSVETIRALRTFTGAGSLAFPNTRHRHRPMSENAMGYLLNRAGYHHRHVPHSWRATFSTVMNECYPSNISVIDFMLAHSPKDKVEAAYNRSAHLRDGSPPARRRLPPRPHSEARRGVGVMLHQVLAVAAALASLGGLAVMACIWVEDRRGKAVMTANATRGGFHRISDD